MSEMVPALTSYGVIGVGAIAAAIVTGLCEDVVVAPEVLLSPRNAEIAAGLAQPPPHRRGRRRQSGRRRRRVGRDRVRRRRSRRPCSRASVSRGPCRHQRDGWRSVLALQQLVAPATDIAQLIPLPSVARRDGITPVDPPNPAAKALFDRLGQSVELVDVAAFDAFSASTATVAADFAYLNTIAGWLESQEIRRPPRRATSPRCSPGSPRRHEAERRSNSWRANPRPRAGSTSSSATTSSKRGVRTSASACNACLTA